jgi:hypothetical protein
MIRGGRPQIRDRHAARSRTTAGVLGRQMRYRAISEIGLTTSSHEGPQGRADDHRLAVGGLLRAAPGCSGVLRGSDFLLFIKSGAWPRRWASVLLPTGQRVRAYRLRPGPTRAGRQEAAQHIEMPSPGGQVSGMGPTPGSDAEGRTSVTKRLLSATKNAIVSSRYSLSGNALPEQP